VGMLGDGSEPQPLQKEGQVTFARTASTGLASFNKTGQRKVARVFSSWASVSANANLSSTLSSNSARGDIQKSKESGQFLFR